MKESGNAQPRDDQGGARVFVQHRSERITPEYREGRVSQIAENQAGQGRLRSIRQEIQDIFAARESQRCGNAQDDPVV